MTGPDGHGRVDPADMEALARRYVDVWTGLERDTLDALDTVLAEGARFKDPFVDVTGRDRIRRHFERSYDMLREVSAEVHDHAISGRVAYLRWTFRYRMKTRVYAIEGMSEVHFDADGLVTAHLDHWDAGSQVYATLPGLGFVIRMIERRIAGG